MKFKEDDFLIVRSGDKNILVRALGKTLVQLNNAQDENIKIDPKEDVVCVLGPNPQSGTSAFGVRIEPYRDTIAISNFPECPVYGSLKARKKVAKAIMKFAKLVKKYNLYEPLRNVKQFKAIEVQKPKPSTYKAKFKGDHWQDQVTIYFTREQKSDEILEQLLYAFSLSAFQHLLSKKRKAKWISCHSKLRNMKRLSKEDLASVLEEFLSCGDARDTKNTLSEDILPFADIIFRTVARTRSVSVQDLELLAEQQPEVLADFWPSEIEIAEGRPDLDKAILRSPQILFATALTKHHYNVDLGKTISKNLRLSLKEIKA